jgi:hypothetical protein
MTIKHEKILYVKDSARNLTGLATNVTSVTDLSVPNSTRFMDFDGVKSRIQINRHVAGADNRFSAGGKFSTVVEVALPLFNEAKIGQDQPIFSCIRPDGSRRFEVGVVSVANPDGATYLKLLYAAYMDNDNSEIRVLGRTPLNGKFTLVCDWDVNVGRSRLILNGFPEIDMPYVNAGYQPWEIENPADPVQKSGEVVYLGGNPVTRSYFKGRIWSFVEQTFVTHGRTAEMLRFLALRKPAPFNLFAFLETPSSSAGLVTLSNRNLTASIPVPDGSFYPTVIVAANLNSPLVEDGGARVESEFVFDSATSEICIGVMARSSADGNGFIQPQLTPTPPLCPSTVFISQSGTVRSVGDDGVVIRSRETGVRLVAGSKIGVRTTRRASGTISQVEFLREGAVIATMVESELPYELRVNAVMAVTLSTGGFTVNTGEAKFSHGANGAAPLLRATPSVSERESYLFDGDRVRKRFFSFSKSTLAFLDEINNENCDPTASTVGNIQAGLPALSSTTGPSAKFNGNSYAVPWESEGAAKLSGGYAPSPLVFSLMLRPDADDLTGTAPIIAFKDRSGANVLSASIVGGVLTLAVDASTHALTVGVPALTDTQPLSLAAHLEKKGLSEGAYWLNAWVNGDKVYSQSVTFTRTLPPTGAPPVAVIGGLKGRLSTLLIAGRSGEGPLYQGGNLDGDWRFRRIQSAASLDLPTGELLGVPQSLGSFISAGAVHACAIADNGDIFIAGSDDLTIPSIVGAGAAGHCNRLARYDAQTATWHKIPTPTALSGGSLGYGVQGNYATRTNRMLISKTGVLYLAGSYGSSPTSPNAGVRIDCNNLSPKKGEGGFLLHGTSILKGTGYGLSFALNDIDAVITGDFKGGKVKDVAYISSTTQKTKAYPTKGLTGRSGSKSATALYCSVFDEAGELYVGGARSFGNVSGSSWNVVYNCEPMVWKLDVVKSTWVPYRCVTSDNVSSFGVITFSEAFDAPKMSTTEVEQPAAVRCLIAQGSFLFAGGLLKDYKGIAKTDTKSSSLTWDKLQHSSGEYGVYKQIGVKNPTVTDIVLWDDGQLLVSGVVSSRPGAATPSYGLLQLHPDTAEISNPWGTLEGEAPYYVERPKKVMVARCRDLSVDPAAYIFSSWLSSNQISVGGVPFTRNFGKFGPP